jgi:Fur family transcriptional regulator, ferric uptake regulator
MRSSSVDQIILKTLGQSQTHLSAQEIYERLVENLPALNPSTVYRSLERLAHEGWVSVSDIGLGAAVYEAVSVKQHHHLVCQECAKVITIDDEFVKSFFTSIGQQYDFQVTTNHLILFGRCSQCQGNLNEPIEGSKNN